MSMHEKFDFERTRGIAWVCDLAGSSRYLNDDKAADVLEQFLPRLYWTASLIVDAAGGKFIKWTGDGFLAWFPTPLYRQLSVQAPKAFRAAQHLTLIVNVTQLGLKPDQKFRLRHGMAYEQDALATKITYPGGFELLDLTGRGIVFAFRLSGISAEFPGIVTQKELASTMSRNPAPLINFRKWQPQGEDKLKYFKGERWGTSSIYVSSKVPQKPKSANAVIKHAKRVMARAEGESSMTDEEFGFARRFQEGMHSGPDWCSDVMEQYLSFVRNDLLGNLKSVIPILEKVAKHSRA